MGRRFDGVDDYLVSASTLTGAMPGGEVTLGMWVRVPTGHTNGGFEHVSQLVEAEGAGTGTGIGFGMKFSGSVIRAVFASSDGGASVSEVGSTLSFSDDTWYLVIFESDATAAAEDHAYYTDGTISGSRSTSTDRDPGDNNPTLILGARTPLSPAAFCNIDIAEVFVVDRFLTGTEKTDLAGGGSPSSIADVTHHWQLKGDTSPEPEVDGGTALTVNGAVQTTHPTVDDPAGDTTPPTLSSPTAAATGQTTASLSVDSDEDCDAYVVVTESATTPTPTQIEAGQDHTGSAAAYDDSEIGASSGTINFDGATGLSAGTTYYAHYWAEDAAENSATAVTSSSFTTDAVEVLAADAGALEFTGSDVDLLRDRLLAADAGALDFVGTDITLTYVSEGTIAGNVTLSGSPVEGAVVRLMNTADDSYVADTTTDSNGDYSFTELPLADEYHVTAEWEDGGTLYNSRSQPYQRPVA